MGRFTSARARIAAAAISALAMAGSGIALAAAPASAVTYACITTELPHGQCPSDGGHYPAAYTNGDGTAGQVMVVGAQPSPPYVDQNAWAGNPGYTATLSASSPGDWNVTANVSTNFGGVQAYPNTGWGMPYPEVPADSYSALPSSWNVTIPADTTKNAGWAAYDLWFNNWADEVMIQTDITAPAAYNCTASSAATIDGMPWHLCVFGSERVWKPGTDDSHLANMPSGSLDLQPFLTWLENAPAGTAGKMPAGSTWTAGSFGFEICDTQGLNAGYTVNAFSFATQGSGGGTAPVVTSSAATGITAAGATLNGTVNPEGADTTYKFDYGTTTSYGSSIPVPAADIGSGTTALNETQALSGLTASTTYHYRIEAANATGTSLGADQQFTTLANPQAPVVTTTAATGITSAGATLNGSVNPEGQAATYQFDYGTTTSYGSVTPAGGASAGSGSAAVNENAALSGLTASTTYHYRIEAANGTGTTLGADQQFTTSAASGATVAYDATGGGKKANSQTLSWTHTAGSGSNRALLILGTVGTSNDIGCSETVKVNGVALPPASAKLAIIHPDGQDSGYTDIWGMANPPAGTVTILVNVANCPAGNPDLTGVSESFTGASQSAPFSTVVPATGNGTVATATVSTVSASDMVAAFVAAGSPAGTARTPTVNRLTENLNGNTGAGNSAGGTAPATGSPVTAGYNITSDWWAAGAVEVLHA